MERWRRWVWCGIVVLACSGRAQACLNDTEVRRTEDEFRGRYERILDRHASWRTVFGLDLLGIGALAGGLVVIGAVSVRAMRRRR